MLRYKRIARCSGHSSYITHIDWSVDGRIIQSACGAYELLYFEAETGKQVWGGRGGPLVCVSVYACVCTAGMMVMWCGVRATHCWHDGHVVWCGDVL